MPLTQNNFFFFKYVASKQSFVSLVPLLSSYTLRMELFTAMIGGIVETPSRRLG